MCPHSRGCSRPCRARLPAGTPGTALGPRVKCCKWWVRGAGAAPGGVRDCAGCRAQPCLQDKPPSGVCGGLAPSRDEQSHPWCAPGPPDPAMPLVWRRACFAPCPKHTSSTPTAQGDVWRRGEKKNPSSSPWQAPEDGFGALRLPLARGWLCAALHTPHPDPRHRGLLVLEGSSLYATPSARTLHTPALCTEAGHCHGPLLAPLEQRAQNTAHTHSPPPRIQPPPGRLPAASSSELY